MSTIGEPNLTIEFHSQSQTRRLVMAIIYRRAEPDDIPGVANVYEAAVSDLYKRYGFSDQLAGITPSSQFYAFSAQEEPEGFWVALDDSEIVGMAISWVRDSLWYLSSLFISPHYQNQGIGQGLLNRTLTHERQSEISHRALITFGYNVVSIALYMRYGMYSREPVYKLTGASTALELHHDNLQKVNYVEIHADSENLDQLGSIDRRAIGISLGKHHQYFLNAQNGKCYLFWDESAPVGYAYVWANGNVGPLATVSHESFEVIMNVALSLAANQNASQISVTIPGSNQQAVKIALRQKLRIVSPYVLMSSSPIRYQAQYLFHSPPLM